jgi:hypothetical protein
MNISGQERQVLRSHGNAGFYIGTTDEDGSPNSRDSEEYWPDRQMAETALTSGHWSQRVDC